MKSQDKQPNIFRPLAFYHPAPDSSGVALSFSYNSSEDKLYLNILRQTGYDEETKRGFFSGEDKKVVKFSQTEAASIADACINFAGFFAKHQFNAITNEISLSYSDMDQDFTLEIKQQTDNTKNTFRTTLSCGEIHLLKTYINSAIAQSFYY